MHRSASRLLVGALLLGGAACESLSTGAGDGTLSARELRTLAYGVSALSVSSAEDLTWSADVSGTSTSGLSLSVSGAGGGGGRAGWFLWGPHRPGVHGTTTLTTDRTAPCPQGGTNRSQVKVTSVVDTVARTGTVTTEAIDTPAQCAFTVDSLNATLTTIANPNTVITITGAPSLVTKTSSSYSWTVATDSASRRRGGRVTRGETAGTQTGSFTYTTSDHRSGSCAVNLATKFDPEDRTHAVTGTFCGQAVKIEGRIPFGRGGRGRH